ncbi:mas-related G-protein coupled receptor member H-like [Ahaetulla prasina]|uniref:mas-related G-protein coupled receptor member H-like n=1 Tax=Ahaetulla prasina TaxID=499056 RepID=UPI0026481E74|nr:mas-related G-protein coupled receptor member H-like [Ahaetulla prasina]
MNFGPANMNATAEYLNDNITDYFDDYQNDHIILPVMFIACCVGLPLNGIVIWLLTFQIKRNPFTISILNLAIADFGYLISMFMYCIDFFIAFITPGIPNLIMFSFCQIMYINGLFLLTAISIDRCVAVFFPIWHRCSRPKYLSSAICVFLWIFSFLLTGILNATEYILEFFTISNPHLVVNAVLCFPLITTFTVILFIKIGLKRKQIKRRRLLMMISITLLCFFILIVPLHIYAFFLDFTEIIYSMQLWRVKNYFNLCSCLNSDFNPVIYFLVGRKKHAQSRESMKVIFQRVFTEDDSNV